MALLKFELEIWQGKLIGEETQIRYFYFELFWYVHSFDSQPLPIDEKYVGLITRGLNMTFTKEAQQRLSLWLRIMKARLKITTQSFQVLREKMVPYTKDPLFQQLRELVFRGFGHYALEVRRGGDAALCLYCRSRCYPNTICRCICCSVLGLRQLP